MDRFDKCVAFVLARETEYNKDGSVKVERDPHDPGGTTKYGIDQRSHPQIDVPHLTQEQAIAIYRHIEWERCRCADLPAPWDLIVFDSAVNPGMGWTIPALQGIAGVTPDGYIGPKTIAAVAAMAHNGTKIESFLRARESYYRARPEQLRREYLTGWLNRVAQLRTEALATA